MDFYKEKGYRDARIISDSLIRNKDNSVSISINVEEGKKYYFGDIKFIGNTVYFDNQLELTKTLVYKDEASKDEHEQDSKARTFRTAMVEYNTSNSISIVILQNEAT